MKRGEGGSTRRRGEPDCRLPGVTPVRRKRGQEVLGRKYPGAVLRNSQLQLTSVLSKGCPSEESQVRENGGLYQPCCARPRRGAARGRSYQLQGIQRSGSKRPASTVFPEAAASSARRSEWRTPMPSPSTVSFRQSCSLMHGSCFFPTKFKNPQAGHLHQLP